MSQSTPQETPARGCDSALHNAQTYTRTPTGDIATHSINPPNHHQHDTPPRQEEYGRDYFMQVQAGAQRARQAIMWRPQNVTHALVHAVTAERQRPYAVVGMDGRFLMSPLLMLPRR